MAISSDYLLVDSSNNIFKNFKSYDKSNEDKLRARVAYLEDLLVTYDKADIVEELKDKIKLLNSKNKNLQVTVDSLSNKLSRKNNNGIILDMQSRLDNQHIIMNELKYENTLLTARIANIKSQFTRENEEIKLNAFNIYKDSVPYSSEWTYKTLRHKLESGKSILIQDTDIGIVKEYKLYLSKYNASTGKHITVNWDDKLHLLTHNNRDSYNYTEVVS